MNSLKETKLFRKLQDGYLQHEGELAKKISYVVENLCEKASTRMKKSIALHKEYTLHDETHLLRVTEIMGMILGNDGIDRLNPIEVMLLILSAYYHDIGMVLTDTEISDLLVDQKYLLFKNNWKVNHSNYNDAMLQLQNSQSEEICLRASEVVQMLNTAILTEYIRIQHGTLSKQIIEKEAYDNDAWKIDGVSFAELVGKIAISHIMPLDEISSSNGYQIDERYHRYNTNIQFLCVILRLADILDFDRERTPDELYRTINFTNNVSLAEWEKHRSITGWEVSGSTIRYTASCIHPAYQRTIFKFMDYIEVELIKCHELVNNFPKKVENYILDIPSRVDCSRIKAKDNSYIYHDLEFTVSRDEIVKLLMMDELYGNNSLCIRELLQNSLDALRYRKNLFKSEGIEWNSGIVKFKQYIDEYGRINLSCTDNGIGMDEDIVISFLTKAGRSYYKSPEFEQVKTMLHSKGIEFSPCSQFGIGFMSCFMLGDEIEIFTKRDYGYGKNVGKPLYIKISGIGGIIVIKEGKSEQPIGTEIRIIGKKKPKYFDRWEDKTWLLETLDAYALECDFPIEAKCEIEEIFGESNIMPNTLFNRTLLEVEELKENIIVYEYDLSKTDKNLSGNMRVSFLKDQNGKLTLANQVAYFELDSKDKYYVIRYGDGKKIEIYEEYLSSICCDGILVCGQPGRKRGKYTTGRLGMRTNSINLGIISYVADIRGSLKPRLTPARGPKEDHINVHVSWKLVYSKLENASGRLWEKVFRDLESQEEIIKGIALSNLYQFNLNNLPSDIIIEKLYIPLVGGQHLSWKKINDIEKFELKDLDFLFNDIQKIGADEHLASFVSLGQSVGVIDNIKSAIMNISYLGVEGNKIVLYPKKMYEVSNIQEKIIYSEGISGIRVINYTENMQQYISIHSKYRTVNSNNSLIKHLIKTMYFEEKDELSKFIVGLIFFITDKNDLDDVYKNRKVRRMKRLGCLYTNVSWDECDSSLNSDIRIWTDYMGDITITKEMLNEWSKYKVDELEDFHK